MDMPDTVSSSRQPLNNHPSIEVIDPSISNRCHGYTDLNAVDAVGLLNSKIDIGCLLCRAYPYVDYSIKGTTFCRITTCNNQAHLNLLYILTTKDIAMEKQRVSIDFELQNKLKVNTYFKGKDNKIHYLLRLCKHYTVKKFN
jgi:hypothetical protein